MISIADFNLSSATARVTRGKLLGTQANAPELDFPSLIEDLCQRVLAEERRGHPAVALHTIPRPAPDATIDVYGFSLFLNHWQILFAPGGTGKSLLAADSIKRETVKQDLRFVICDSIAPACIGRPEEAEAAIECFKAFRRIGVGGLAIAHTRAEDGEQRPFGSVFWHNLARSTWFLHRVTDATTQNAITLGVFHRKSNLGRPRRPFGLEMVVDTAPDEAETLRRVTLRRIEITDVPDLASGLALSQRMRGFLRTGARTRAEIAAEFEDTKADTLRRVINRGIEKGHLVRFPGPGGTEQIGLPARGCVPSSVEKALWRNAPAGS